MENENQVPVSQIDEFERTIRRLMIAQIQERFTTTLDKWNALLITVGRLQGFALVEGVRAGFEPRDLFRVMDNNATSIVKEATNNLNPPSDQNNVI